MLIHETFTSIQGEGIWLGMPSFFIRVSGCNLQCRWCDSKAARSTANGHQCTLDHIVNLAVTSPAPHVVITGGEPALYPDDVAALCRKFRRHGKIVTVETNATMTMDCQPHLMSLSPKLDAWDSKVIEGFCKRKGMTQIKIVVNSPAEGIEALQMVKNLGVPSDHVFFMPRARTRIEHEKNASWLVPFCIQHGIRFAIRAQTIMWDNEGGR